MTLEDLRHLPASRTAELDPLLHALWQDAQGHWDVAHSLVDELETPGGCWVHAYLHRKEGDAANAAYWYQRANKTPFSGPLEAEWTTIATALLARP